MRVAVIHPWLPQYRVGFFEQLLADGSAVGIDFQIFHGAPPPEWASRGDSKEHPQFTALPTKFLPPQGRSFNVKDIRQVVDRGPWDLIVLEQAVRNIETYQLLVRRTPIAFWGHGKTYTKRVSGAQEWLKSRITRRGVWFFSYTSGGALAVAATGFPNTRITVIQNSIDSMELHSGIASLSSADVKAFRQKHALNGPTALFMGGLDASKRLDFLLSAASRVSDTLPNFRLLVAGDGSQRSRIERAERDSSHVLYLGRASGREKALALAASNVIAMPGRVGLLAVDSFVAQRPIITTDWAWHAPEFEYLENDRNAVVSKDNEKAYSEALIRTLTDTKKLQALQAGCAESASQFTIQEMSRRFVDGVLALTEVVAT